MPDYEKMYFNLQSRVSDAIDLLIEAQLEGENAYLEDPEHMESPSSTESTDAIR